MIAKCSCQKCGVNIEFDVDQAGQFVSCPSCEQQTRLLIPKNYFAAAPRQGFPPRPKVPYGWFWVLLGVLLMVLLGWFIYEPIGNAVAAIFPFVGSAIGGIILIVLAVIGFILACLWTFFPWFVFNKMNRLNELLEKIEENTRKE